MFSLDGKINKIKNRDKDKDTIDKTKSDKNLLNAINSQIFDQYKINPYNNQIPLNNSMNFLQNPNQFNNNYPINYPNNYQPTNNIYQNSIENMNNDDNDDEEDENTAEQLNYSSKKKSKFIKDEIEKIDPAKKKIKTNKVINELNDNLENFHFEFSRQISKLI